MPRLDENTLLLAIEAIRACGGHAGSVALPAVAGLLKDSRAKVQLASAHLLFEFRKESVIVVMKEMCVAIKNSADKVSQRVLIETVINGSSGQFAARETAESLLEFLSPVMIRSVLRPMGERSQGVRLAVSEHHASKSHVNISFKELREVFPDTFKSDGAIKRFLKKHKDIEHRLEGRRHFVDLSAVFKVVRAERGSKSTSEGESTSGGVSEVICEAIEKRREEIHRKRVPNSPR